MGATCSIRSYTTCLKFLSKVKQERFWYWNAL